VIEFAIVRNVFDLFFGLFCRSFSNGPPSFFGKKETNRKKMFVREKLRKSEMEVREGERERVILFVREFERERERV
jgi:hypothetical protein